MRERWEGGGREREREREKKKKEREGINFSCNNFFRKTFI